MFPGTGVTMATATFGSYVIEYGPDLLAPRAWTIEQSHWAIELLRSGAVPEGAILELCCGAGQIGLVVAAETDRPIVQVDDHLDACTFAMRNATSAGITVDVRCEPVERAVRPGERFAVVLTDPPYVPTDQTDRFDGDPAHAIDGGDDGLDVARRCVAVARGALLVGGAVLVQLGGEEQARRLAVEAPFDVNEIRSFGADRAILLLRD